MVTWLPLPFMFCRYYRVNSRLDTDIHIPLYVRGPGLEAGSQIDVVTTHTDIASTLLKIAGVDRQTDGQVIPFQESEQENFSTEHASIEFWGRVGFPLQVHPVTNREEHVQG